MHISNILNNTKTELLYTEHSDIVLYHSISRHLSGSNLQMRLVFCTMHINMDYIASYGPSFLTQVLSITATLNS